MLSLSTSHVSEISPVPELVALVDNACIPRNKIDQFTQLCALHNCVEGFLHALPHSSFSQNTLTFLARLDRWDLVQHLNVAEFSSDDWKRAIRRAGRAGHMRFVENILSVCEEREALVRTAVVGASMNDQIAIVQRFLSSIDDQDFLGHVAVTAAQHGSLNCAQYCLTHITPKQWLSALSSTITTHQSHIAVANMLLDNTPQDYPITHEWAVKFTKRLAHSSIDSSARVWRFILPHMPWNDVQKIVAYWPNDKKQILRNIYQNVVLTDIVENTLTDAKQANLKRKM